MKKIILTLAAAAALAGCARTWYSNSESYVQSGHDCIVKTNERGVVRKAEANNSSRVVYPNVS
jgi:hypothetical protein